MKTILRSVAVILAVSAVVWWLAAGANRGWTKTSVPVVQLDEVTGLESRTYVDRFVPGLEVLGGLLALAGAGLVAVRFVRPGRPGSVSV